MKTLLLLCVFSLCGAQLMAQNPAPATPMVKAPKKLKPPKPAPAPPIAPPGTLLQVQPDGTLVQVQLPPQQPQPPQNVTQTNGPTQTQIVPGVGPVTIQQPVSVTPTMVGHQVIYQPGVYATEAPKILPGGKGHIVYSAPGGGSIITGALVYNESDPQVVELALAAVSKPAPPVTVVVQKEAPVPVATSNYTIFKPCCPQPAPMMLPPPPPPMKTPCGFSRVPTSPPPPYRPY